MKATEHAIKAAQSLITLSIINIIGKIIMVKLIEALLVSTDRKERALGRKLVREMKDASMF